MRIAEPMRHFEIKMVQNKKKISPEMLRIIQLPPGLERLTEFRKHAAIYGRFDSKRDPDKVLTLHEVSASGTQHAY